MPLVALIALFIIVPLAELYVIFKVGDAIGVVWTILILAADSILGSLLLKSQGRTVWLRFNEALASGRMPHREVIDGVCVIFGGALLITPGFLTDIVGLALLHPADPGADPAFRDRTARAADRRGGGEQGRGGPQRRRATTTSRAARREYEPPPRRLPR